jgi:hypothetical protein
MDWSDLIAVTVNIGGKASGAARQVTGSDKGFVFQSVKLPLLFLLIGLVSSFILVRVNTRLIRKGVSWWPGNIESGDLHIHHVVFGFSAMVLAGVLEFALTPTGWTQAILALIFGGGMGVALDEFALILHIKDVYWTSEGRQSIDAVVIVVAFVAMLVVGLVPLSAQDAAGTPRWGLVISIVLHAGFVIITLIKGKLWTGVVGVFIPVFAWVGAIRLARPNSPWAHRRYPEGSRKLERARERAARSDRRWARPRNRFFDLIGGKPTADETKSQ